MQPRRRQGLAVGAVVLFVIVATAIGLASAGTGGIGPTATSTTVGSVPDPYLAIETRSLAAAKEVVHVTLPTAPGAPAPSLGSSAFGGGVGSHQVVGFVPYYELSSIRSESLAAFTDLVYYEVDLRSNGSLVESSSSGGWSGVSNGGAASLVAAGHAAGDRVLLSVFTQSESVLGPLCSHAATTGALLGSELAGLLAKYHFDGVDLDLEGRAETDRAGYVRFVAALSARLAASDRSWVLMVNTYPQSAEDPTGFFDVKALSQYASQLFVMAYDMDNSEIPSPDAPLAGANLSDASALASYAAAGLAPKVILGVPFYGYDFPASGKGVPANSTGPPYAVTYDAVATSISVDGHLPLWDPQSETPYTVFRRDGKWHQTWFDDPVSVALKMALAAQFKVAGVGAWEIGMVQSAPQMLSALAGGSTVVKLPLAAQP